MTLFGDISGNSDYDTNTTGASKYLNDLLLVKKDKLNNDQNSNKRMIAFNESYRKKQGDYIWLLLYVFIALIIFCFFYIMRLFFPFIPDIVMDLLYVNLFAFLILFIACDKTSVKDLSCTRFQTNVCNKNSLRFQYISNVDLIKKKKRIREGGSLFLKNIL